MTAMTAMTATTATTATATATATATPTVVTNCEWTQSEFNREARLCAGAHRGARVEYVGGDIAPHEEGQTYHWTTLSGRTRVWYPNSYGWRTWYHHSTLRVVVGIDWHPMAQRADGRWELKSAS